MRLERAETGSDPQGAAARVRALAPAADSVTGAVGQILAAVREGGDVALRELVARFDAGGAEPPELRLPPESLETAVLDPEVRAGLEVAIANVALVADAGMFSYVDVALPQGHHVLLREVPVRRAAIYVPGGRRRTRPPW